MSGEVGEEVAIPSPTCRSVYKHKQIAEIFLKKKEKKMEDQQINRSIVSYMEKHLVVQSPLWWR
jgi:hypothetical protein